MPDNVNITVNETIENIVINPSISTDVVDVNVSSTTETVNISVTPELTTINLNTVTGGTSLVTTVNAQIGDVIIPVSDNNFTTVLKNKLDGIQSGAEVNVNADWNSTSGDSQILNKPTIPSISGLATVTYVDNQDLLKVDKVEGKELSSNDFTNTLKTKLDGVQSGAEVNVNADWNATSGDAQILNKPTIPSASSFVPYTGATDDLDLGSKDIYLERVFLNDAVNGGYASIHYADGDFHIEDTDGHKLLVIEDGFIQLHKTDTIQSNLFTSELTATRDHYLPNQSGTIALTSDITGTNSGTNTGDETTATIKSKLGITTLSGSNTGDQDLTNLVVKNTPITAATKTKITYDEKGLVTSGAEATTADISDSTNKRYVTDANLTTIGNQSGTNTGDNATNSQYSGLATSKQDTLVSGTNIKTINGSSVLGSGDLVISGGGGGASGVHNLLGYFNNSSFGTNVSINTQTTVTLATTNNRLVLFPFIPAKDITSSSLNINVTATGVGALARILIYSNLNGLPNTKLYESADLSCTTIGVKTATTTFSFIAGSTYWLALHTSNICTVTAISQNATIPIFTQGVSIFNAHISNSYIFGSSPETYIFASNTGGPLPLIYINS